MTWVRMSRVEAVMSTTRCLWILIVAAIFTTLLFIFALSLTIYVIAFMDFSPKKAEPGLKPLSASSTVQNRVTTVDMTTTRPSTGDMLSSEEIWSTTEARTTAHASSTAPPTSSCKRRGRMYASYIGSRDVTVSGTPCLIWQELQVQETLQVLLSEHLFPDDSWQDIANKCRNPNNLDSGPWCFKLSGGQLETETCGITPCTNLTFEQCEPNPCDNGAHCTPQPEGVRPACDCTPGHAGPYCMSKCAAPEEYPGGLVIYETGHTAEGFPCVNASLVSGTIYQALLQHEVQGVEHIGHSCIGYFQLNIQCIAFVNGVPADGICSPCSANHTGIDCRTEGIPYAGSTSYTASGHACLTWRSVDNAHDNLKYKLDLALFPERDNMSLHAECRNPDNDPLGPWCYAEVRRHVLEKQHCHIPACPVPLEPCSSSPCLHGGTCTNSAQRHTCHCAQGYTGVRCQAAIREDCRVAGQLYTGRVSHTKAGRQCLRWEYLALNNPDIISLDDLPDSSWAQAGSNCRELQYGWPMCVAFGDDGLPTYFSCSVTPCQEFRCKRKILFEGVEVSEISTSSNLDNRTGPSRSRLDMQVDGELSGGWVAGVNDENQWIQMLLEPLMILEAILTQGRREADEWVTQFTLAYRLQSRAEWRVVLNTDEANVFEGNRDRNTVTENRFLQPLVASLIRLSPVSWHQRIALRWEMIACDTLVGKTALQSDYESVAWPATGALDGNVEQVLSAGSCVATTEGVDRWWSVDLGRHSTVHSLIIFPRLSTDGCSTCLRHFNVWVSEDSADPFLSDHKELCIFREHQLPASADHHGYWLTCEHSIVGRYVTIQQHGVSETLTFCEMLVRYEEAPEQRECFDFRLPYTGDLARSASDQYCAHWDIVGVESENLHYGLEIFPGEDSFATVLNKCRDIANTWSPTCAVITGDRSFSIEACDVPLCSDIADFDVCVPNPCLNGARCEERAHREYPGYTCVCPPGYYGILCESGDCLLEDEGSEYTGTLSYNELGFPCVSWYWAAQTFDVTLHDFNFPDTNWDDLANKCRFMPSGDIACVTNTNFEIGIARCAVPRCPVPGDCMDTPTTYTGLRDVTAGGKKCFDWLSVFNADFGYNFGGYAELVDHSIIAGMSEPDLIALGDKCRNPNDDPGGPWCYAADLLLMRVFTIVVRPMSCDIPLC